MHKHSAIGCFLIFPIQPRWRERSSSTCCDITDWGSDQGLQHLSDHCYVESIYFLFHWQERFIIFSAVGLTVDSSIR